MPPNWSNFLFTQLKLQAPSKKETITSGGFDDEFEVWSFTDTINTSQLSSTQEEADIRIILHAINSNYKHIVVSSKHTDVLVLLASHYHSIGCTELWMMTGTHKKTKYIPMHNIVNTVP